MILKIDIFILCLISAAFVNAYHNTKNFYKRQPQVNDNYIECEYFPNMKKKNFALIVEDDAMLYDETDPVSKLVEKIEKDSDKIRYSLCQLKQRFETDIKMAELEYETFKNEQLEQLDGTLTSRKVGIALRNIVIKVGECASTTVKQVLVLPTKVEPEMNCIMYDLMTMKNFSTDVANIVTDSLKSIVNYPRLMANCFKNKEKISCLARLHRKVIKRTILEIMQIIQMALETNKKMESFPQRNYKCGNESVLGQTASTLALIPMILTDCIQHKIYSY